MSDQTLTVTADRNFTLSAVRKDNPAVLLQMRVSWVRLMEDVVIPYDAGEMFFVDGAAVRATELDRLKILLNGPGFSNSFALLNRSLKFSDMKSREMYAKQYPVFIEAMLREHCDDVTSQVISAYKTAIKPKLRDHLPDKNAILDAGVKLFVEGLKTFTTR